MPKWSLSIEWGDGRPMEAVVTIRDEPSRPRAAVFAMNCLPNVLGAEWTEYRTVQIADGWQFWFSTVRTIGLAT